MKQLVVFLTVITVITLSMGFAVTSTNTAPGEKIMIRQAFMEQSPGHFDRADYVKRQLQTFNWLLSEAAPLSSRAVISIYVSQDEFAEMNRADCEDCGSNQRLQRKLRVGLTRPVDLHVKLSGITPDSRPDAVAFKAGGMVRAAGDGGYVWTAGVESDGAEGLRVHFTNMNLPEGAQLYIYNQEGEAFGPYTHRGPNNDGDFWSNTVSGSLAYLQVRANAEALGQGEFEISGVGHMGKKWLLPFLKRNAGTPEGFSGTNDFCSFNAACVEDASCYNSGAVGDAKKAVAYMQWISGAWIYSCSGGLVADSDNSSQIPYFITANHCISRNKAAGSVECYWQFQTSNCGGACYDPVGVVPRTLGAVVLSTNKTSDYTLMQLSENPPSGSVFLGWNSTPIANTNNADLYRISHPGGAPQAYSYHKVDTTKGTCSSWPRGNWIYSRDITGATEGGSSGSPVVNSSGQLVGQLSGGCGTNVNETCDAVNNATVDGAFAAYYSTVAPWLGAGGGPGGTEMHVASIVLTIKRKGPKTDAVATVTILDENGDPVSGAAVSGTFSGDVVGSASADTNTSGTATIKVTVTTTVTSFGFCTDNVSHSSLTYNSGANVETCDSI